MTKRPNTIKCPECGACAVFETRPDTVEYKGHIAKVNVAGYWYEKCGEAIMEANALEKRERAFLDLRAKVNGVLRPHELQ